MIYIAIAALQPHRHLLGRGLGAHNQFRPTVAAAPCTRVLFTV